MAGKLIFRNDDVSASSNLNDVAKMYSIIRQKFADAEIWSCVNLFSRGDSGSVYPELPLRGHPKEWFYHVDRMWKNTDSLGKIVSHGLFHAEHGKLDRDAQEMSILSSCRYLKTDVFVAPFSSFNEDTKSICERNGITLASDSEWRSLESEQFNPKYSKWYWHSWRFTPESFKELFDSVGVCK